MRMPPAVLLALSLPGCGVPGSPSAPATHGLPPAAELELRNALHDALHGGEAVSARGRDRVLETGRPAVPFLLEALASDGSMGEPNPAKALASERVRRRRIAFLLGEIRDPSAIPALLEHYDGEACGKALAKITGRPLGNDLWAWREWYVSQPPASRDELSEALAQFRSQGDRQRLDTAKGLAEATRPRTGAAMLEAMPSALSAGASRQVQLLTAVELDRCRAARAFLPEALTDPNPDVRRYARMVALQLGHLAVEPLRRLAASAALEPRALAVYTLGEIGDRRALPELTRGLSDADAALRARAAWAIGQIGSPDSAAELERRLGLEPDASVRAGILGALVQCGRVERFEELAGLLEGAATREAASAHLEAVCRKAYTLALHRQSRLHLPVDSGGWQAYKDGAALGKDPERWKRWWTHPQGPARDLFVKETSGGKP